MILRGTRSEEEKAKEGEKKSGTSSEVGMWSREEEGRGGEKRRAENDERGYLPTVRGSPSQITPVYALKCEMVQTAQLP